MRELRVPCLFPFGLELNWRIGFMSVIGFFESASPAVGSRVQPGGNGMGAGMRVEGAVLAS